MMKKAKQRKAIESSQESSIKSGLWNTKIGFLKIRKWSFGLMKLRLIGLTAMGLDIPSLKNLKALPPKPFKRHSNFGRGGSVIIKGSMSWLGAGEMTSMSGTRNIEQWIGILSACPSPSG